ncbi:uncharacterized protein LOC111344998 [Stylophora pistillata]|uniref:uncharacterized protein LOC111344998 n=1 Tax=Stylophora pistillata TaxID=50429 RepID=UPI000C049A9A|nr:uncharacterized protein LOC111344998 [Stylophora pistillata]
MRAQIGKSSLPSSRYSSLNVPMVLSEITMVVPQKTENQFYADIVRSLRQNFRSEPQLSVTRGEKKVRIRTNRLYKSALTEDHWRDKYNRHVKQRLRGFYTPAHVPYASVGDVCLDTRDLVMKTVGFDQSSEKCNVSVVVDSNEKDKKKETDGENTTQKKSQEFKGRAYFSLQGQGGLREIKEKLCQCRDRLSALQAGQSFEECLRKENIMSMVVDAMKGPQGQLQMTEPSSLSPSKMKKMFNKLRSSDEADGQGIGEELIAAFSSEIKSEHEEEVIDQREVHDRYVRNFSSKLRSLYTLLCYVYHLRTKDLRTKVPLSKDFLKTLKTKISTDQKGKPLRHTRNMTLWQLQPHGPQRSSTDTTVSRMDHDHQLSPQMNTRSSFVTDSPSSIFRTGITGSGVTESRTSFMGRKLSLNRRYGGILHVIQNAAAQTSEAKDQLPIWHQVASAEKNAKENGTKGQFPKRRLKKSASKSENSLCDMIREGFDKIQARSAEQVGEKLSKINRKEKDSFIAKLQAVDPYSVFRVDLQRVREADRVIREDYEKEDVKSAPWYRDLENEAQELGVAREAEVIIPLNNLYPFAFDDITTLPFVQAKLCLIVQSLPIYELCSLSTLEALKFLLAKILNCSSGTFNEWMNQRKLLPEDKVT